MGKIVYEGCLKKSPPEAKMKKESAWHVRFFMLVEIGRNDQYAPGPKLKSPEKNESYGNYLMYWENALERKKGKRPLGIIPIRKGFTLRTDKIRKYFSQHIIENVIELETFTRTYILSAPTEKDMAAWFQYLQEAICNEHTSDKEPVYARIMDIIGQLRKERTEDDDKLSLSSEGSTSSSEKFEVVQTQPDTLQLDTTNSDDIQRSKSTGNQPDIEKFSSNYEDMRHIINSLHYQIPSKLRATSFMEPEWFKNSQLNPDTRKFIQRRHSDIVINNSSLTEVPFHDITVIVPFSCTHKKVSDTEMVVRSFDCFYKIEKVCIDRSHSAEDPIIEEESQSFKKEYNTKL